MSAMGVKGLRQFLDDEQQRAWLDGQVELVDGERPDFRHGLEQRFRYAPRFEKLLRRPQADDILAILRAYAATAIPIPRTTERFYWSVSCLPGSPDKPLVRISASFMEFFALHALSARAQREVSEAIGEQRVESAKAELVARFILHLADFTTDGSADPDRLDHDLLERCAGLAEACPERSRGNVSHAIWRNGVILIAKVRGAASIRHFLAHPHALRAIRGFNLTHMNRGRNAYQASHCYSLADAILD